MLMAAGSETPLVVLLLASPLVAVVILLPFLRGRSERLRASLLYGALGLFAATVGMAIASAQAGPHDRFANIAGWFCPLTIVCGAVFGATIGACLRK